jgi:hypothetical protein
MMIGEPVQRINGVYIYGENGVLIFGAFPYERYRIKGTYVDANAPIQLV